MQSRIKRWKQAWPHVSNQMKHNRQHLRAIQKHYLIPIAWNRWEIQIVWIVRRQSDPNYGQTPNTLKTAQREAWCHIMSRERSQEQFVQTCFEEGCTNPLTINDLTTKLFSSKTVLSQSIKEQTGLSPMTFLRNVRLEQVRSQLIRGDSSTSIISVAQKYGFPSRGHFSRYYRELFGELPSETAARSKYF